MTLENDGRNLVDEVPERFVPATMGGSLEEAEHLSRYVFAAAFAPGRRVLDAGCGAAYGTNILARGGATDVVGIDVAESVLEVARQDAVDGVELRVGDVRDMPFVDAGFDLVACFEVIEHVDDRERTLDEIRRVLAPGGVVLLSSPNRGVYVPGNPHHVYEYEPEELREALAARFAHVRLVRQDDWIVSALLDDGDFAEDDAEQALRVRLSKTVGREPGRETYTVAIASDAPLPETPQVGVATATTEVNRWLRLFADQQGVLEEQRRFIESMNAHTAERTELRVELERAERRVGRLLDDARRGEHERRVLERRLAAAEARADELDGELDDMSARVTRADRVLRAVMSSPSWRVTAPLRLAKRVVR